MLRASPLCACCRHYPGTATGGVASLLPPSHISLPRNGARVGLCNVLFEDCSAFTRVTACTLAGSPKVIRYIEGFSYFVTSITAPIASGWSEIAVWDSHPLRNAALSRRTPIGDIQRRRLRQAPFAGNSRSEVRAGAVFRRLHALVGRSGQSAIGSAAKTAVSYRLGSWEVGRQTRPHGGMRTPTD